MDKIKKIAYWVTILPPIFNGIKAVITAVYNAYMNTLMEIEEKKMKEDFVESLTGMKGKKK